MFFLKLLSRLPLPVLYVLSDVMFFFAYYVVKYRRKLVRKNLENAFPEKTLHDRRQIEKQFYRNLCDYAVEMLKLITISKAELNKRMYFTDTKLVEQYAAQNQSIIFLASHQFNWEWLLASASVIFPMQVDFVYQPLKSKFFDRLSFYSRSRFGAYGIKRKDVARSLVKRKDIVRGVATVADQYPGYDHDKKFAVKFLNQDTVFFLGTNTMTVMAQYPAIYYSVRRIKRGYYETYPHLVATPPYDKDSLVVIENYVKEVERAIQHDPAGWLWSHNRWKSRHLNAG